MTFSFWFTGRMFWTDWDRLGPKIEAANMDGTERMVMQRLIKAIISTEDLNVLDSGQQKPG